MYISLIQIQELSKPQYSLCAQQKLLPMVGNGGCDNNYSSMEMNSFLPKSTNLQLFLSEFFVFIISRRLVIRK
jgi:hypothetical protein